MKRAARRHHWYLLVLPTVAALAVATVPVVTHAASLLPDVGGLIPDTFKNLDKAFRTMWDTVVGIAGITFLGYLLYGGFLYLTSSGDEAIATKARHTLRDAGIGMALVVLAWPIGLLVLTILGQQGIISGGSNIGVPTGGSTTPLSVSTNNGVGTTTNQSSGTTPTTGTNTGSTKQPVQTTTADVKAAPNSTFTYTPTKGSSQTVKTDAKGESVYNLDPSFTYTSTDIVFLRGGNQGVGQVVPGELVNIYRQALGANDELMYSNVLANESGHVTIKLPVNEQIKIIDARTGTELLRNQTVQGGAGNQIQAFVPAGS